jgi:diaminopimelate epimerase
MRFTKMHGAGNDYVYVDCFRERVPRDVPAFAVAVSDRHRGIGADGLILIRPSELADARMQMFNADGSEAEMCGNGIRCVGKYLYDHGHVKKQQLGIETGGRIVDLELVISAGKVEAVRVDMGLPILDSAEIPTTLAGNPPLSVPLLLTNGRTCEVTSVSMGNPHCVLFTTDLSDELVRGLGPLIENHAAFPQRTNVEFVRVISATELEIRVWERGSGETQACGSGACAAVVAAVLQGLTDQSVNCRLPGGLLDVHWSSGGNVFLSGPATEVFSGDWPTTDLPVAEPSQSTVSTGH